MTFKQRPAKGAISDAARPMLELDRRGSPEQTPGV